MKRAEIIISDADKQKILNLDYCILVYTDIDEEYVTTIYRGNAEDSRIYFSEGDNKLYFQYYEMDGTLA